MSEPVFLVEIVDGTKTLRRVTPESPEWSQVAQILEDARLSEGKIRVVRR